MDIIPLIYTFYQAGFILGTAYLIGRGVDNGGLGVEMD